MSSRERCVGIIHRIKVDFWTAVIFFSMNAVTILTMPLIVTISKESGKQIYLILLGSFFWLSLIFGYTFVCFANRKRKLFIISKLDGDLSMGQHIGLITFFSNMPALIVDSAMFASVIVIIIIYKIGEFDTYFTYAMLAVIVFTVNMHCMFNGRIYKTTKFRRIRRKKL